MEKLRTPLQGVWNIMRFNWHFYLLSVGFLLLLIGLIFLLPNYSFWFKLVVLATFITSLNSLIVSTYVYDFSDLYLLDWLPPNDSKTDFHLVNINAGFDETSVLLEQKYPKATMTVLDFYDPKKHTEISIKRARKAYPPFPNTQNISTSAIDLDSNTADLIILFLSAHEIRNEAERIIFFKELQRILKPAGQILVTEHLRDLPNFLAYTIGFFHFHSKAIWLQTFAKANLKVTKKINSTPFITTFILKK